MKQDCYFRLSICGTILISLMLIFLVSGCTAMVPLGRDARLGYVAIECRYLPPIGNAELGTWNAERGSGK
jgi:hypothetical protein